MLKAMTVFSIGLLLLSRPFNGSFHLKALVGVFVGLFWLRLVFVVVSELGNCCPLEACTSHCTSAASATIVS